MFTRRGRDAGIVALQSLQQFCPVVNLPTSVLCLVHADTTNLWQRVIVYMRYVSACMRPRASVVVTRPVPPTEIKQVNVNANNPYAYLGFQLQHEPNSFQIVTEIDPFDLAEMLGNIGGFWGTCMLATQT